MTITPILIPTANKRRSATPDVDAFWHVLYLGVLSTICLLWSPSKNNLQYAYMDELSAMEEEGAEPDEDAAAPRDDDTPFKR